jgi:NAD(P)-dependent dehydrogenase (short-subunit alcohol dehydrogenase family)
MTKAAIVNFTRSFAQQAIEKGIRVNAVAPGPVWTPLIPSTMGLKEGSVSNFGKQSYFKRPAQPIELATLYVFLASSDANYVTSQVYGATGEGMP